MIDNQLKKLIKSDQNTLESLKNVLSMITNNNQAYDYLKKIIEDMEDDLKELTYNYFKNAIDDTEEDTEETQKKPKLNDRGVEKDDPAWEELFEFLDKREFSVLDMLACACTSLCRLKEKEFETHIMVGNEIFKIEIQKRKVMI